MHLRVAPVAAALLLLACRSAHAQPVLTDPTLRAERVRNSADPLTQIEFLGRDPGEYFLTEKDTGRVFHVLNRIATTVLDLPVYGASFDEAGLLGMALHPDFGRNGFVYLYYTAGDGPADGGAWAANRVSRFTWNGSALVNERVLRTFGTSADPADMRPNHFGGPLVFGPDGKLYGVAGDVAAPANGGYAEQNNPARAGLSAKKGAIFRLSAPGDDTDGAVPADNPFVSHANPDFHPWFAYGVRNSFGLGFDPVTRRLWDTENGSNNNDEINLVAPGFNSGWTRIMGPAAPGQTDTLVHLPGSAYSDPELTFPGEIAPTDLAFLAGSALGPGYDDAMVFAGTNQGRLHVVRLNGARDGITGIPDLLVNSTADQQRIAFGQSFGIVTDLDVGPDGYLYVLNLNGNLYRIVPEPAALGMIPLAATVVLRRRR